MIRKLDFSQFGDFDRIEAYHVDCLCGPGDSLFFTSHFEELKRCGLSFLVPSNSYTVLKFYKNYQYLGKKECVMLWGEVKTLHDSIDR